MAFVGRKSELEELNSLYQNPRANLVVIYGRRRVGKSTLIEKFMKGKLHLSFEGLEKVRTKGQIKHFTERLIKQLNEFAELSLMNFETWSSLFDYLTTYFETCDNKCILFLDEFQWLAVNQYKLVSLIKFYWDNHWSKQNVMLILCGSVSSYMTKKVIRSKALYGRINWELCLEPLPPDEIYELLDGKRSQDEILLYSLVFGGIPKYLQEIDPNKSFDQNINKLFFIKNALFSNEYSRIFYSQFKEHKTYEAIVSALKDKPLSLDEITKETNISSGGALTYYLYNLEQAAFITSYVPYNKNLNSKLVKYKLTDEYIRFYFKICCPTS